MGQPNTVDFEELGTEPKEKKYAGPFYRKDSDGKYRLAQFCAECAFGDEAACLLNPCILLSNISNEELKIWVAEHLQQGTGKTMQRAT